MNEKNFELKDSINKLNKVKNNYEKQSLDLGNPNRLSAITKVKQTK